MTISVVAVGAKITAAITNLIIAAVNAQGRTGVVPTAVSGTGVSVGTLGKVTLTAATTPAIDGCFTSTYERYVIEIDGVASTTVNWSFNFRAAGVDVTSANYDLTELLGRNATVVSSTTVAAANWSLSLGGTLQRIRVELSYPAVAQATAGLVTAAVMTNPQASNTTNGVDIRAISHRLSTAYDGFKLTLSGGTFTGAVRIYGENNL